MRETPPLELWGGVECTVNRVGDRWLDQLDRSGHAHRIEDLDLVASLGIRTMRYPILWERIAPDGLARADWRWADERLRRLRDLGITPIVGLVHHGSGPAGTSLLDPEFPRRLAEFAGAVAERYPWLELFTPVNEPLTTARFSALYGLWYPHERDERASVRALLNQLEATRLAMRAIRRVIPGAKLVQTEDVGRVHSTAGLRYQADFENERRWLTFDLLCGRLVRGRRLRGHLRWLGVPETELQSWEDDPCPPDVLGVNHYLTSDRFLDERLERYPAHAHGGNGRDRYADVEAVRVLPPGETGPLPALLDVWERYRLPIAVTEAHLGCTREQQVRWLLDVWRAAERARAAGAGVRAVTLWSMFGAYDWDSLLTCDAGNYESGAFDVRGPRPRPTALAEAARQLAAAGRCELPACSSGGWWALPTRVLYPARAADTCARDAAAGDAPVLVVGAAGTLGRAVTHVCGERGLRVVALSRQELDLTDAVAIARVLDDERPWAVVNASGYVRVDDAEHERWECRRINTDAAAVLAEACSARGIRLAAFSTDLVFDGARRAPYQEDDPVGPLNVYGESKARMERLVGDAHAGALVVRTSAFFGPWDEWNFATLCLRAVAEGQEFRAADDAVVSPTYVPDLAHATLDLLLDGASGLWHLANAGACTWAEMARELAGRAGLDAGLVRPTPTGDLGLAAQRPAYSALASERGSVMPSLESGIERYLATGAWRRPRESTEPATSERI